MWHGLRIVVRVMMNAKAAIHQYAASVPATPGFRPGRRELIHMHRKDRQ